MENPNFRVNYIDENNNTMVTPDQNSPFEENYSGMCCCNIRPTKIFWLFWVIMIGFTFMMVFWMLNYLLGWF